MRSQKNMKSLQLDSDKKVREMENMITKFQESLKKELEITKDELSHTKDYNAKLLGRNIFARIFNKKYRC